MEPTRDQLFAVLIREHEPLLRAFVRSVVYDAAATDDIVQDVFVAAWRSFDTYDHNYPLAAWLRGVAKNKIRDHFRRHQNTRREQLLPHEAVAAIADEFARVMPFRGGTAFDAFAALEDCMAGLPPGQRELIDDVYRRDQPCPALAERLGESVEATRKRLQRIRLALRDCIAGKLRETEAAHA